MLCLNYKTYTIFGKKSEKKLRKTFTYSNFIKKAHNKQ